MSEVRERLLKAPVWVLALLNGTLFGLAWVAWMHIGRGESWTAAVVIGLVAGVAFGAVVGPVQHRQWRGMREVAARSPVSLSREARRASWRGPVPADPGVREAAHDLLVAQLEPLERQRLWAPVFFVLLAALSLFLAVSDNTWWWLAVIGWAVMAVAHPVVRNRQLRRAELLRSA